MNRSSLRLLTFAAVAAALLAVPATASAKPSYTSYCNGCHSGTTIPVTLTQTGSTATQVSYSYSAPGADMIAVFLGSTRTTTVNGSTGVVTLNAGSTYTIYAVNGPGTNDGVGTKVVTPAAPAPDPDPVTMIPVAGASRFETAVEASKRAFPTGLDPAGELTVVIATGRNWPDALGGTSLAGALDGPVLLVDTNSIPAAVTAEIERLGAQRAIILGGAGAIGTPVQAALEAKLGVANVSRIWGTDRYKTADAIAEETIEVLGAGFDGTAFVATGANFPDALAAAPLAAAQGWPLFLADPAKGLSADTKLVMTGVDEVLLLGGSAVVSPAVEQYLVATYGDAAVTRLSGASRYQTAVTIASYGVANAGLSWDGVGITTGERSPDALAGGIVQGRAGSVMLLTLSDRLDSATAAALSANKADISTVTFFGGTGAVSQGVRDSVAASLR